MRYVVGVDVGGTNLVAGTIAEDGSEILGVVSEPTMSAQGADAVISRIVKLARASIAESGKKVEGVGIGSPGPLDTKTGIVLLTPNLGWTNMPLRDRVGDVLKLPRTYYNDGAIYTCDIRYLQYDYLLLLLFQLFDMYIIFTLLLIIIIKEIIISFSLFFLFFC